MRDFFICWFLVSVVHFTNAQKVSEQNFDPLLKKVWIGELSYLDYSSNKLVPIKANLSVHKLKENTFEFAYSYPGEPGANSTNKVRVLKDGAFIGKQEVLSVSEENGMIKIVTAKHGKDNGKKAIMTFTYLISDKEFSMQKEVKYRHEASSFIRNKYSFKSE